MHSIYISLFKALKDTLQDPLFIHSGGKLRLYHAAPGAG